MFSLWMSGLDNPSSRHISCWYADNPAYDASHAADDRLSTICYSPDTMMREVK